MGDEWGCIRYPFWGFWFQLGLDPVLPWKYSGLFRFFQFITVFSVFGVNQMETWNLQPLVSTSHSGLLIRMKGVLQGISGGALWLVR